MGGSWFCRSGLVSKTDRTRLELFSARRARIGQFLRTTVALEVNGCLYLYGRRGA